MQDRGKGDQTKQAEWSSLGLGKAAGNQALLLEMVQVVTEDTCGLVGLLLQALLPRALLISNPPHLWRQKMDSRPLRIKNVSSLGKSLQELVLGSTSWPPSEVAALLGLRALPGLSCHGCSELLTVLCNLALVQVRVWYHECENGPPPLWEGAGQPRKCPGGGL